MGQGTLFKHLVSLVVADLLEIKESKKLVEVETQGTHTLNFTLASVGLAQNNHLLLEWKADTYLHLHL